MGEKLEILGLNAGYFLGYDGRFQKYLRHPLRSLVGDSENEKQRLENLIEEIKELDPDIVGMVEIDQGSIRTFTDHGEGQTGYIQEKLEREGLDYQSFSELKYRHLSPIENFPLMASMSNGVLFKKGEVTFHDLHRGWKRLLIEVKIQDLSIFICHLPYPVFKRTQKRQLEEMAEIMNDREKFLLYGDFNLDDLERLDTLRKRTGAKVHSPGLTYPTYNPEKPFDIFITGPKVELKKSEILDTKISDHKPVRAEFRF